VPELDGLTGHRSTDATLWQHRTHASHRGLIELEVFLERSGPELVVAALGFVPHLPIPLRNDLHSVAVEAMLSELAHQLFPQGVVLGRRNAHVPIEYRARRIGCERRGHRPELDDGSNALIDEKIENLVRSFE